MAFLPLSERLFEVHRRTIRKFTCTKRFVFAKIVGDGEESQALRNFFVISGFCKKCFIYGKICDIISSINLVDEIQGAK